jgi:hypothetical protein
VTINGLQGMTTDGLNVELARGGKFVIFQYAVSLLIVTFKRSSGIYFVRANESVIGKGFGFTLISFLLGWWGLPWGPIYTIQALATNLGGGKDVTQEVIGTMNDSE